MSLFKYLKWQPLFEDVRLISYIYKSGRDLARAEQHFCEQHFGKVDPSV